MAVNFNHRNSISSVGLGLGTETIDVRFFVSPTDSNLGLSHLIHSNLGLGRLGLISHRVAEVEKTYVSPNRVEVHSTVIDYAPTQNRPAFPLHEVPTVTEVVKTTRFLTSTSTLERIFAPSSRASNQGIFPTTGVCNRAQPAMRNQPNQVMNFLLSENPLMNQYVLNILKHSNHVNVQRETTFSYSYKHPSYNQGLSLDQTAVILPTLDNLNKSNYNMNQDRGPSFDRRTTFDNGSSQLKVPSPYRNQPRFHISLEEVSDYDNSLGYDGRTHSLPDYPEGVYGCPKCFATFYSSQTFAAHIQTHYKKESKEERRRRMAAKCRRRNLRLQRSSHGLTVLPESSKVIAVRRKNDIAIKIENAEEVHQGLGLDTPPGDAKNGPLHVVMIKEEPM